MRKTREVFLFITPWILGTIVFVAYPLIRTIYFSFYNVKYNASLGYIYKWVAFDNYHRILTQEIDFIVPLQDFIVHILLFVPIIIALSIIIAMLLNIKMKGTTFFRLIFFLPVIILNGQMMANMKNFGGLSLHMSSLVFNVINQFVPNILISLIVLLFNTLLELLWYCGVPSLIFLASLQKIDKSQYEAAQIDGASAWNIFWEITLPTIYPLISVTIVYIVVFLGNFDGNPINQLISAAQFDGSKREGYASAEALIYAMVQSILIVGLFFLFKERKKEGGKR